MQSLQDQFSQNKIINCIGFWRIYTVVYYAKKSFELNNWDIYSLCKYAWVLLFCCTVVAHCVQFSKMNNYRHKSECSDNPLRSCPNWQPHYKNSKGDWLYFYSAVRIGTKDGGLYIKLATNTFPYSAIAFIISVIAVKKKKNCSV